MKILLRAALMLGGLAMAPAAEMPRVTLFQQEFTLMVIEAREEFTLNEYVPLAERGQPRNQLLSVTHAPRTSDPLLVIQSLLRSAMNGGLLANRALVVERTGAKKGEDVAVLLVFRNPDKARLEYNMWRYVKEPGVEGLKSYQYARHYPEKGAELPDTKELTSWLDALWELQLTVHAKPPK